MLDQIIHYRFFHPMSKFLGPFWVSVTRFWVAYHNVKADELKIGYALYKRHSNNALRI